MQWGTGVPWLPRSSLGCNISLVHPVQPQCKATASLAWEEEEGRAIAVDAQGLRWG